MKGFLRDTKEWKKTFRIDKCEKMHERRQSVKDMHLHPREIERGCKKKSLN